MRTPSLYSQDDPISAALKPSPMETEAERTSRLYAEAEAKRVSEQIDDDLREERERLKKKKGDVKVSALYAYAPHILICSASFFSSVKPRAGNRRFRNSSSSCINPLRWIKNAYLGQRSSTLTSFIH